ncbi:MAG TPA: hypothetical protein VJ673_13620 [Aromatoleum sp.]|uniref:hypothetical protein n=1 Tax=Aromatoleum sp. TaxID=2307007 RepID=UPI002B47061E|nr:hypothetical protein [Aromatoleum sp.]HJV26721.1 hypothetical protein [Aromatoleum sp.]
MKLITTMLFAAALLTGCATRGTNFAMSDVEVMQPGVTTYSEAVARLGKPASVKYAEDGRKSVLWLYVQASLVGAEHRGVRVSFDKDDKMIRIVSKAE